MKTVSSEIPDWSRERPERYWDPGRRLLMSIRQCQKWNARRGPISVSMKMLAVLRHRFWSIVTGAEIDLKTEIGSSLKIPHPNGIVIHPKVQICPSCLIFQQVTIGATRKGGTPRIGGHIDIGAGAKILGDVYVGDHALIGANSVVVEDVPPGATVAGIPAKRVDKD